MSTTLRHHQKKCDEITKNPSKTRSIFASVTPGGGKTGMAIIAAKNLIGTICDKVVVIVPRDSLKFQFEEDMLDPRFNSGKVIIACDNNLSRADNYDGYSTTYQGVNSNIDVHVEYFKKHRVLLVCDEAHHLNEDKNWGDNIETLRNLSAFDIIMSGTLSRGDKQKISFLEYDEEGYPILEDTENKKCIVYSRKMALKDRAILPVEFQLIDGYGSYRDEDDKIVHFDSLGGDSKNLYTALRTEFAELLLSETIKSFDRYRKKHPWAKMLVIAPRISIAEEYLAFLKQTGFRVDIATSLDNDECKKNIKRLKKGHIDVLVTVGVAYEGLNVPEISHIAVCTHIRQVAWLNQCFARCQRNYHGKKKGYIFAPNDDRLVEIIKKITKEQQEAIELSGLDCSLIPDAESLEVEENNFPSCFEKKYIEPISCSLKGIIEIDFDSVFVPSDLNKKLRDEINKKVNKFVFDKGERWRAIIWKGVRTVVNWGMNIDGENIHKNLKNCTDDELVLILKYVDIFIKKDGFLW